MQRDAGFAFDRATRGTVVAYATVSVYYTGHAGDPAFLASIFEDDAGLIPKSPIFTTDEYGYWYYYAAEDRYDVCYSGGTPTITPWTDADHVLYPDVNVSSVDPLTFACKFILQNTAADAFTVRGGIVAGSGAVQLAGADGRIPAVTSTYFANLDGSHLTGVVAAPPAHMVYDNGSYSDPSWITALAGSKITGNITGQAGTVANGLYSTGSYSDPTWLTALAATKLTGTIDSARLPAAVVLTSGSYADPAWITSLAASKVGLALVENTKLSTWVGSANLTTLGTIGTGVWHGSVIGAAYLGSGTPDGTKYLRDDNSWQSLPGGTTHNLLSGTHSDTVAASPVRGDVIIGNSTPKWARLAIGTVGKVLRSDGTDVSWQTLTATDVGLSNVENTKLSTWAGSANITTLGTIASGSFPWANISGKPTNISTWTNDAGYITSAGSCAYANSAGSVPWGGVVGKPTNVSAFTNDAGYITGTIGVSQTYNVSLNGGGNLLMQFSNGLLIAAT